jgi:GNAT superfamily N-acetyltransferase
MMSIAHPIHYRRDRESNYYYIIMSTLGSPPVLRVCVAHFTNDVEAKAVARLLSAYSEDAEFGAGVAFTDEHQSKLAKQLGTMPGAFTVLAYHGDEPVGVATCFASFSTWKCAPLVNVHDIYVVVGARKQGVCSAMLQRVDDVAVERGCCKLTLEVLPSNGRAKGAYGKHGFGPYDINGETLLVYQKLL